MSNENKPLAEVSVPQAATVGTGQMKVITIEDPQAGKIRETTITASAAPTQLFGGAQLAKGYSTLREAATSTEFPLLMQDGLKAILFDAYNGTPVVYPELVQVVPSNKERETYIEGNQFGTAPKVGEGQTYPNVTWSLDRTVQVVNDKYGYIFPITEEMIKFDKTGLVRQLTDNLGVALRNTIEDQVFGVLNTTGNYARNSTTGDNDVGANTGTTTFSATALVTALRTIITSKDRRSGTYLGLAPDTLLVSPGLEFAAKQLLLAPEIVRASANNAAEVYGTGQSNPFRGIVRQIIVSPRVGTTFGWVLFQKRGFAVLQEVEPLQLLVRRVGDQDEAAFTSDVLRVRGRVWFGTGIINDRNAYMSDSTTAPAVA